MKLMPDQALFEGAVTFPTISSCDHYAGNLALAEKAIRLQSDYNGRFDVTLDLEDGAHAGDTFELLKGFVELIQSERNIFKKIGIRIHDFHAHDAHGIIWKREVDYIAGMVAKFVSHITIPKTRDLREAEETITYIQRACQNAGYHGKIPLHVIIETPQAAQCVSALAALPWLRCLDFGAMDFVSGHNGVISSAAMRSPGQFEHELLRRVKVEMVAAASAHSIIAAHNVTIDYKNVELTKRDALRARNEFGFCRMWSIHPAQITPILEAMSPPSGELALAARIMLAAFAKDWAPVSVDGILHDRASYRYYWALLRRAHAEGAALAAELQQFFAPT